MVFFRPQHDPGDWRPRPGYHPQVDVGSEYTSCVIESLGEETVFEFEQEYTVGLRLLFPDLHPDAFSVGSTVNLYEGSRAVGTGILLEVL